MSFFSFENKIIGNELVSVEYYADNKTKAILVKRDKDTLNLNDYTEGQSKDTNYGHFITINTNQVLHKSVTETYSDEIQLINKAFPSLVIDDFYYSILKQENNTLLSICRKDYLNAIINQYHHQKIPIIGIGLGNHSFYSLSPFLSGTTVLTNTHIIQINSDSGFSFDTANTSSINDEATYEVNGININASQIIGFAGITDFISQQNTISGNISLISSKNKTNYFQEKLFKKGLIFAIGSILCGLLINFLIFNYYFTKTENNNTLINSNSHQLQRIKKLQTAVSNKKKKADEIIASKASNSTLYIHQINQLLPKSITLNSIDLNPVFRIKNKQKIKYESQQILIEGITNNNEDFRNWLHRLEKMNWIKKCTITSLSKGNFSIKITYHENSK